MNTPSHARLNLFKSLIKLLAVALALSLVLFSCKMEIEPTPTPTYGSGTITITNPTETPTVSFTLSDSITKGTALNVTASVSTSADAIAWYLDGTAVPGQTSLTFTGGDSLDYGTHSLMVVITVQGTYASATRYFIVE